MELGVGGISVVASYIMVGSGSGGGMDGAVAGSATSERTAAGLACWGAAKACWVDGGGGGETLLTIDRCF